jgi:RNA-directed DNA polymerase
MAVLTARDYASKGYRWVVDMDLEKFFDRVNHDIMMSRLARRIGDRKLLKLIRSYLKAGLLQNGVVTAREMGTPQGGPLSPLLSNILLDELDKELERRGHKFCRYADDCNIYVKSRRAGERVLASIRKFLWEKLKLTVSETKSKVDRPWKCKFLGYSMTLEKSPRLRIAPESCRKFRKNLRVVFRQGRGRKLTDTIRVLNPKLRGWCNYFQYAACKKIMEELDGWIRSHLRCIIWRQWKKPKRRRLELIRRGIEPERAKVSVVNGFGPWWNANASHMKQAFPKRFFDEIGLIALSDLKLNQTIQSETAVYGTVCTVV